MLGNRAMSNEMIWDSCVPPLFFVDDRKLLLPIGKSLEQKLMKIARFFFSKYLLNLFFDISD